MSNANMFSLPFLLSFFFLFLFHIALSAQLPSYLHHEHAHDSLSDEEALLAFKRSLALDPFHSLRDWTPLHPFCNWTGVACSPRHHRVVSLNLTEYGIGGKVWIMGDVYSFGILLLELLTRKRPTDDMFVEGMNIQKWVDMHLPNRIVDVVDNHLIQDVSASKIPKILTCLTHLMQLGLVCASESPQKRPSMMEIVNRLTIIISDFSEIQRAFQLPIDISSLLENTRGMDDSASE